MLRHKVWLYSVNFTIVLLEILLFYLGARFFSHPWMQIFPISQHDSIPKICVALIGFQIIACICGFVGTCGSKISLLKVFWILIISLVVADVAMINQMANWMSSVHKNFAETVGIGNRPNCTLWNEISRELNCCPDVQVLRKCRSIVPRCDLSLASCTRPLLQWLHNKADQVALLIYFILLPLKCLVVFVLREDIRRIFFIQEVSGDYDEDEDEYFPTQKFRERATLREIQSAPQRLYGA